MSDWLWLLAVVTAALSTAEALLFAFVASVALPIFERRPPFNVKPCRPVAGAETVRFPTTRGLFLTGSLIRPEIEPRGLIVFCPEFGGSRWSAAEYAAGLIEGGFAVFAFDFRNSGDSDSSPGYRPSHWATEGEVDDVRAALRHVSAAEEFESLPIGLFGISRGANAALAAAARTSEIAAVCCEGAFATDSMMLYFAFRWAELYAPRWFVRMIPEWHLAATLRFARRVSAWRRGVKYVVLERELPKLAGRPVLLVTGERDSYVAPVIPELMRERIGAACDPVWVVPEAKHNQARPTARAEYDRRVCEFFNRIAFGPSAEPGREAERPVVLYAPRLGSDFSDLAARAGVPPQVPLRAK